MADRVDDYCRLAGPVPPGVHDMVDLIEREFGSFENALRYLGRKAQFRENYRQAETIVQRWKVIREYYRFIQPAIDSYPPHMWATDVYDLPTFNDFTPIERAAWHEIRCRGAVMYPQYPVLNYFVDFANPKLKLALEADGARWHSPEKDAERDRRLMRAGWTVYRVTGSECLRVKEWPGERLTRSEYDEFVREWYLHTVDGVVDALLKFHILPGDDECSPADECDCEYYAGICQPCATRISHRYAWETLRKHRSTGEVRR